MLDSGPPTSPIMVRVAEAEPNTALGFADLLLRSLGLTAVLGLAAALLGLLLGALWIGVRIWRARRVREENETSLLRVTPGA